MRIEGVRLEIERVGSTAKLIVRSQPFAHELRLSLSELDRLIAELIRQAGQWRADLTRTGQTDGMNHVPW